jgi:hypothetical protein
MALGLNSDAVGIKITVFSFINPENCLKSQIKIVD